MPRQIGGFLENLKQTGGAARPTGYNSQRSSLADRRAGTGSAAALAGESKRQQWVNDIKAAFESAGRNPDTGKYNITLKEAIAQATVQKQRREGTDYNPGQSKYQPRGRRAYSFTHYKSGQEVQVDARPAAGYAKRSHRRLSVPSAQKVLRDYYRSRIQPGDERSAKSATRGMRRDLSMDSERGYNACPTRTITYMRRNPKTGVSKRVTRRVTAPNATCTDNWLYRSNVTGHDMAGVDSKGAPKRPQKRLYRRRDARKPLRVHTPRR